MCPLKRNTVPTQAGSAEIDISIASKCHLSALFQVILGKCLPNSKYTAAPEELYVKKCIVKYFRQLILYEFEKE